ncbi:MAG: lipocalin family protein [SAR324 cluster bacterium]|nr:lipocalin family protein [SAR324 cluster bacterium]
MNQCKWITFLVLMAGGLIGNVACSSPPVTSPKTVTQVDLQRYIGLWYEIAKIPNRFQKQCVRNVTASYSFSEDGNIKVINRCLQERGDYEDAQGVARIVDSQTNAKLEVSFVSVFGKQLFWGAYWIIGLGDSYDYAIIGHPQRKYGWILSRSPQMETEQLNKLFQILATQGYDPTQFVITEQTTDL